MKKLLISACVAAALAGCGGSAPTAQQSPRAMARMGNLAAARSATSPDTPADAGSERVAQGGAPGSKALANGKMVLAYYSGYTNNYSSLTKYYANVNAVAIDFWNITPAGAVVGNGDPTPTNAITFLKSKGIAIYGCISNVSDTSPDGWDPAVSHAVTGAKRAATVANLVSFAKTNGFAGINIDFEAVDQADRKNLSDFAAALATALHAQGMKLIMTVPAFSATDENDIHNLAFDLQALGQAADYIQVMTYDETIPAWDAGPVAGSDWMENALDYATSKAPAAKVLNGIPAYGYDWIGEGDGSQLYWRNVPALLTKYGVTPKYDNNVNAISFSYTVGGRKHTVWNENARSVTLKTSLVSAYGLAGTSIYAFGMEDASFWSAVNAGLNK
ncbi:glycosyl hydrolase family 18 protein [Duganella violaceipulchra]|uniref:Chitinase n=1 Tax=Duganella violaceipulchra TaxID=2849652 RepID=A0AA41L511_9BURK|nr:glycosyl hydrolase family 18 protein [Duganella violaceicalia]MBV6323589.1 chitinase [Duganella violaceicalia]MCP2008944.1 spore germination protein YaaH [Duganella violaceicalia]